MLIDNEPNNNLAQAQIFDTTLSGTDSAIGSISNADVNDVYQFTLANQPHNFSATLTFNTGGVFNDVDLEIFRDANFNGFFDTGDKIIDSFDQTQGATKSIELEGLGAGTYYARVRKDRTPGLSSNSIGYNLSLTANPGLGQEIEPNNDPNFTATAIKGNLNGFRKFEGSLNRSGDLIDVDYYSFNLDSQRDLRIIVDGPNFDSLDFGVTLHLYRDSNGDNIAQNDERVASSFLSGNAPESIFREDLPAGKYFVEVFAAEDSEGASYSYELSLDGTPLL